MSIVKKLQVYCPQDQNVICNLFVIVNSIEIVEFAHLGMCAMISKLGLCAHFRIKILPISTMPTRNSMEIGLKKLTGYLFGKS